MATLSKIYSDIDFTFTKKPVVGDVALSYDQQAVVRSIRNLLLTNFYERPFNPRLGSNISLLLFEPISSATSAYLEKEIENSLGKLYLPKITKVVKQIPLIGIGKFDRNAAIEVILAK